MAYIILIDDNKPIHEVIYKNEKPIVIRALSCRGATTFQSLEIAEMTKGKVPASYNPQIVDFDEAIKREDKASADWHWERISAEWAEKCGARKP